MGMRQRDLARRRQLLALRSFSALPVAAAVLNVTGPEALVGPWIAHRVRPSLRRRAASSRAPKPRRRCSATPRCQRAVRLPARVARADDRAGWRGGSAWAARRSASRPTSRRGTDGSDERGARRCRHGAGDPGASAGADGGSQARRTAPAGADALLPGGRRRRRSRSASTPRSSPSAIRVRPLSSRCSRWPPKRLRGRDVVRGRRRLRSDATRPCARRSSPRDSATTPACSASARCATPATTS